jgi:Na+-transporting NADH:ubiquinone oxidoreductase subunit NqrA
VGKFYISDNTVFTSEPKKVVQAVGQRFRGGTDVLSSTDLKAEIVQRDIVTH